MTDEERARSKDLWTELKRRRSANEDCIIKAGKIVQRNPNNAILGDFIMNARTNVKPRH